MFVVLKLTSSDLIALEFGQPVDPVRSAEAYIKWMIKDYAVRREALWDVLLVDTQDVLLALLREAGERAADLVPILAAVGALGRPEGVELVAGYLSHKDDDIKRTAIRSLGQMGSFSSIEPLRRFLYQPNADLRREAFIALGKFGKEHVLPDLKTVSDREPALHKLYPEVYERLMASAVLDMQRMVEIAIDTDDYEDLMAFLMHAWRAWLDLLVQRRQREEIRVRAARLLGLGRVRKAGRYMCPMLEDPSEPLSLKLELIIALGRCKIRAAFDGLVRWLSYEDPAYQDAAVTSLGQLGKQEALEPLLEKWNMRDDAFRRRIMLALRRLCLRQGSDSVIDSMRQGLTIQPEAVHIIADDLSHSRQYEADLIHPYIDSDDPAKRHDAALVMAICGGSQDEERLNVLADFEKEQGYFQNLEVARLGANRLARRRETDADDSKGETK